jgi:hypothetical protein
MKILPFAAGARRMASETAWALSRAGRMPSVRLRRRAAASASASLAAVYSARD